MDNFESYQGDCNDKNIVRGVFDSFQNGDGGVASATVVDPSKEGFTTAVNVATEFGDAASSGEDGFGRFSKRKNTVSNPPHGVDVPPNSGENPVPASGDGANMFASLDDRPATSDVPQFEYLGGVSGVSPFGMDKFASDKGECEDKVTDSGSFASFQSSVERVIDSTVVYPPKKGLSAAGSIAVEVNDDAPRGKESSNAQVEHDDGYSNATKNRRNDEVSNYASPDRRNGMSRFSERAKAQGSNVQLENKSEAQLPCSENIPEHELKLDIQEEHQTNKLIGKNKPSPMQNNMDPAADERQQSNTPKKYVSPEPVEKERTPMTERSVQDKGRAEPSKINGEITLAASHSEAELSSAEIVRSHQHEGNKVAHKQALMTASRDTSVDRLKTTELQEQQHPNIMMAMDQIARQKDQKSTSHKINQSSDRFTPNAAQGERHKNIIDTVRCEDQTPSSTKVNGNKANILHSTGTKPSAFAGFSRFFGSKQQKLQPQVNNQTQPQVTLERSLPIEKSQSGPKHHKKKLESNNKKGLSAQDTSGLIGPKQNQALGEEQPSAPMMHEEDPEEDNKTIATYEVHPDGISDITELELDQTDMTIETDIAIIPLGASGKLHTTTDVDLNNYNMRRSSTQNFVFQHRKEHLLKVANHSAGMENLLVSIPSDQQSKGAAVTLEPPSSAKQAQQQPLQKKVGVSPVPGKLPLQMALAQQNVIRSNVPSNQQSVQCRGQQRGGKLNTTTDVDLNNVNTHISSAQKYAFHRSKEHPIKVANHSADMTSLFVSIPEKQQSKSTAVTPDPSSTSKQAQQQSLQKKVDVSPALRQLPMQTKHQNLAQQKVVRSNMPSNQQNDQRKGQQGRGESSSPPRTLMALAADPGTSSACTRVQGGIPQQCQPKIPNRQVEAQKKAFPKSFSAPKQISQNIRVIPLGQGRQETHCRQKHDSSPSDGMVLNGKNTEGTRKKIPIQGHRAQYHDNGCDIGKENFDDLSSGFLADLRDCADLRDAGDAELLYLEMQLCEVHSTALRYCGDMVDLLEEIESVRDMASYVLSEDIETIS